MASLSAIGGVLAQRNARIFYSGSIVCWTGSWVQHIATDWLAWELTHSALWLPSMIGRVLSTWGMITRAAPAMGHWLMASPRSSWGCRSRC